MTGYHVLRVFCARDGSGGNQLAVFLTGALVADDERQAAAAEIGFSETVFVDDVPSGRLRILTPAAELGFAGHPLVGAAWLIERERDLVDLLRPPAGAVPVHVEGDRAYVSGKPEWSPPFEWIELGSPAEVDALTGAPGGREMVAAWAWIDETLGRVRARVFPGAGLGIAEDEATGSAALLLGARLGRELEIHQGRGSVIEVRPGDDGLVEIEGTVVDDGQRKL